jgi:hypothetical protein
VENEGENDYEPILNNFVKTNNIQKAYIDLRRYPENKGKETLKKSPSFKINNFRNKMLTKIWKDNKISLTDDNNIVNNDNMANKDNKKIIMNYTKKDIKILKEQKGKIKIMIFQTLIFMITILEHIITLKLVSHCSKIIIN